MALIQPDKAAVIPSFAVSAVGLSFRDDALSLSALIGRVENESENAAAVKAQSALKRIATDLEKARREAKSPFIEAGRQIDTAIARELAEVDKESGRISNLTAGFQLKEQRRIREEQEVQARELARIEVEKQEAIKSAGGDSDKVVQIESEAASATYAASKPITASREVGQVVKTDWEIVVTNPYELAKFHPDCVDIKPLLMPIKQALNDGRTLKGVTATKVLKTNVRPGAQKVIDV